jgi:homoserine kinase
VDCQYKTSADSGGVFFFARTRVRGRLVLIGRFNWKVNVSMLTARVPATIANMGPGFDSFGMAVSLYNQFHFEESSEDCLLLTENHAQPDRSITMGSKSVLFQAMDRLYERADQERPAFLVKALADIPMTRGLGSSSTAIIAGLIAANYCLENTFKPAELLEIAAVMEGHPDNVAPALLGGVVLCDTRPYPLPWPAEWRILALSPAYPVLTEKARQILPASVMLEDSIFNLRKASVLTYALLRKDPDALRAALQDRLHQPYRRQLIREYDTVESAVQDTGAFGLIISGSGSTMAIFYPEAIREVLLARMQDLITHHGWEMSLHDLNIDTAGAQLIN